jgi:hypothetical protein
MPLTNIFISSTFEDLKEHRRTVWEMLRKRPDVKVHGMEEFGARAETPLETCMAEVEQADVYVGIVGFRLGSVDRASGKSFTQLEFERAVELTKRRLIYIADEKTATFPAIAFEKDTRSQSKLNAFKSTLREQQVIQTFSTPTDLAEKIQRDIQRDFPQQLREPVPDLQAEFDHSLSVMRDFRLTPKRLNGAEVRLSIGVPHSLYPASRALCQQFNVDYGSTVGMYVTIKQPDEKPTTQVFNELYATGRNVEVIRRLKLEKSGEIYASLLFSEADVAKSHAEFFGRRYFPEQEYDPSDDDGSVYVPSEGKIILLFTKPA